MSGAFPTAVSRSACGFVRTLAGIGAGLAFALGTGLCAGAGSPATRDAIAWEEPLNALALGRLAEAGVGSLGTAEALPRRVDNSALPSFPPLFDQGDLESCTAVVSTYYQLTHSIGLMRGWDQSRRSDRNRFSPALTYNLTNNGENVGVSLPRAYEALAAHGALTLAAFPYRGTPSPVSNLRDRPEDPALWREARTHRIARFGVIDAREPGRLLPELKRLLLNGHLLTASTAIEGWNRRRVDATPALDLDGKREASPHAGEWICTEVDAAAPVSHAITIVGYDDELWVDLDNDGAVDAGERGALKIVNSYGRRDWNAGFRWLHYAAVTRDGAGSAGSGEWRGAFWRDRVFWLVPEAPEYWAGGPASDESPAVGAEPAARDAQ